MSEHEKKCDCGRTTDLRIVRRNLKTMRNSPFACAGCVKKRKLVVCGIVK